MFIYCIGGIRNSCGFGRMAASLASKALIGIDQSHTKLWAPGLQETSDSGRTKECKFGRMFWSNEVDLLFPGESVILCRKTPLQAKILPVLKYWSEEHNQICLKLVIEQQRPLNWAMGVTQTVNLSWVSYVHRPPNEAAWEMNIFMQREKNATTCFLLHN